MKSITRLKDDARKHELREEWDKAIQVYLQVLDVAEGGQIDLELPLYNRIGDLCVRLNRPHEAVRYYEQAADRYAEAGLYNNAIALCNKALRYNAEHTTILRKLGQFSASQGFVTDARRYYIEFADRQAARGAVEDGLAALSELAVQSDDPETREVLGDRLQQLGRTMEAVREYMRAWTARRDAGEDEAADALRARIDALDPHAFDDADVQYDSYEPESPETGSEPSTPRDESSGPPADDAYGFEIEPTSYEAPEDEPPYSPEPSPLAEPGIEDESAVPGGTIEGLETTMVDMSDVSVAPSLIEGLDLERDETSFDDDGAYSDAASLRLSGFEAPADETERDAAGGEDEFVLPAFEPEPVDDDEAGSAGFVLPTFDSDAEAPDAGHAEGFRLPEFPDDEGEGDSAPAGDFELPVFGDEPQDDPDGASPAYGSEPEWQEQHDGPVADLPLLDDGWGNTSLPAEATDDAAGADQPPEANGPVQDAPVAEARGQDVRTGDAPGRSAGAPDDDGYVDLGALVIDDEEDTTRFTVNETAPTGDEDRDFAELLSQFKSKVSEHLPPEDAAAHYDLGLAFKEMGLIDEAIAEFQVALRAGPMRLKVCEELGDCFLHKQQFNIAEKVLRSALQQHGDDDLELIGVYYHLGRAYEGMGSVDRAKDAYERVLGMDINFGDVSTRLARL